MPGVVERAADEPDAAVHHVARRHHVGAGLGLRHRHAREDLERRVVDDLAVLQDAVVAVAGVGIHGHVGDHGQIWLGSFDFSHGPLHQPVGIGALHTVQRLVVAINDGKQRNGRNPKGDYIG